MTILKRRNSETGVLEGPPAVKLMQLSRSLPGAKRFVQGRLHFGIADDNIKLIKELVPDLDWSIYADELQAIEDRKQKAAEQLAKQHGPLPDDESGYKYQTEPYEHQRRAFQVSRDAESFALLMEMGTGKTKVSIDTAAYLYDRGEIDCLLVFAPNNVHAQWVSEQLPVHWPKHLPITSHIWRSGKKPPADLLDAEGMLVVAMNIEGISRKGAAQRFADLIVTKRKVLLIVDESSRIKNHKSGRAKYLTALGKRCESRRILTGTPITQGPHDFFSQFLFLDPDIIGVRNFTVFQHQYCLMGGWQNKQVTGHRNIPQLQARIAPYAFVVKKEDCLDLPDKIYMVRDVGWEQEQADHYNSMLNDLWTQFDDGELLTADLALPQLIRLQQILGGFLQQDNHLQRLDNQRLDICEEVIEESQGKTLIFARFREEHRMLEERFGDRAVSYHGGISSEQRVENIHRLRHDDSVDVFIANQQSAGIGLDLSCAQNVIYYSNSWSLEERLQSEDRAHRIGQTSHVTYTDLRIPDTLDDRLISALRRKKNVANMTIDNLRFLVFGEEAENGEKF